MVIILMAIDYVVIIGAEEVKSNIFKLKNMKSGSQSSIDISNLLSEIESISWSDYTIF